MHDDNFKRTCAVGANIVVGYHGGSFVCDGTGVQIIVNLFGLFQVHAALFVLAVIMIESTQVKVIKVGALFPVEVILLFVDFLDGTRKSLLFHNGCQGLVSSHGLIGAGTKQQQAGQE